MKNFRELGLSDETLKAIARKGFEEPSQIQALTIPKLLQNEQDIVGQAQTGTGKTAAFGLPLIELLSENSRNVQALILVPTRELAIQVAEEINSFRSVKKLSVLPIYGGQAIDGQLRRLKQGVDIVVGTPGRLIDHLRRKSLKVKQISHLILDEADEMLNMGFLEDIEQILESTNENKRVLLFSATMPQRILQLAQKYLANHEVIRVKSSQLTINLTDQIYFEVNSSDKFEALCRIIDIEKEFYALIFCRTKIKAAHVADKLGDRGYSAEALHGDISQSRREAILNKFKKKRIRILVATDVAARGIDINDLTHVLNYSIPRDPEAYIHRVGRTGRAGKEGTAITFVTPSEYRKLLQIQRIAKTEIRKEKLPQVKDLICAKKMQLKSDLLEILDRGTFQANLDIADELLAEFNSEEVIAAIITKAYRNIFNPQKYVEIRKVDKGASRRTHLKEQKISVDTSGTTRLFIAVGNKDKFTKKKLIGFIKNEAKINSDLIRDVKVFDNFSFANVPFQEAEKIIKVFRNKGKENKPLVVKAKPKEEMKKTARKRRAKK